MRTHRRVAGGCASDSRETRATRGTISTILTMSTMSTMSTALSRASTARAPRAATRGSGRRRGRARAPVTRMVTSEDKDGDGADEKRALVPVAFGSEEMETVIVVDVLRRAGTRVTLAAIGGEGPNETTVTCSRGVRLEADARLEDVADERWDLIALPGGMPGAQNMAKDATLHRALERQMGERGALTAAMCASPGVVLAAKGLLHGLAATAHPGFVKNLPDAASANARVVVDGDVITSRGPGTAIEFALALVEKLYGAAKAQEVAGPMVLPSVSHGNRVPNEWRLDDAAVLEN